ncbi:MAG: protein kinase [Phycisphaerae bacterium]|nr:protein kinase [Phycisphaerae bacterium]
MTPERQARVEEIFLVALELPEAERLAHVDTCCAGDHELRLEVLSLLSHHDEIGQPGGSSFMDSKAAPGLSLLTQIGATALKGDELLLPPDRRLGSYTVQGVLGQGGMGIVYLAEQDRPRRTVALKVMRRGVGSERLVRRFEFEAELLGKLQHPGIAQVYEAGTFKDPQSGTAHPYIAMELVRGKTITKHAEDRKLATRERLALAGQVCDALHHAHMCGVIHRDLKPANILADESGQTKILDFGVARSTDRDVAVTTMQTSVGQIIGTLPYMSPEQIAGDTDDIDTRSDVYSMGVVLYELLTGRLPYEFRGRSLPEAARVISDAAPMRLSTIDRSLRGDIETIVGKALSKEKERRYQSAAELAADLRSYLDGRPIAARQDSALYVLRTQLNRYRGAVAAAILFLFALVGFALYANAQARENAALAESESSAKKSAQDALLVATREKDRADTNAADLRTQLAYSNIERGRLLGLSGNLAGAEALLWPEHLRALNSRQTFYALWELYSNARCLATIEPGTGVVARSALSADARFIAATGSEPAATVWDTATLERVAEIKGAGGATQAIAFHPDGRLALGDSKGRLWVVEPSGARTPVVLRPEGSPVLEALFNQAGDRLLASCADGSLFLYDSRAGAMEAPGGDKPLASLPPTNAVRVVRIRGIAASPVERRFAIGSGDQRVRVVSADTLDTIIEFPVPDEPSPRLDFNRDGSILGVSGLARVSRFFDPSTGSLLATLDAPNGTVNDGRFTPDGKRFLNIGWWYLQVWNVETRRVEAAYSLSSGARDLYVTPDGRTAWTNLAMVLRAWDLEPLSGRSRIEVADKARTLARFLPDGTLISGDQDGGVRLLSDPDGNVITTLGKAPRRVRSISLSPTAPMAAAASADGWLLFLDLENRRTIAEFPRYHMVTNDGIGFSPDGSRVVLSALDYTFKVLEFPSGKVAFSIPSDRFEPLAARYSPDGKLIATTTRRNLLCLYDAQTGALVRECETPNSSCPWTIRFTADGTKVLSGNWNRAIYVWDVATGRNIRRLEGHRGLVTAIDFRPREPDILASAAADGRIMLWDLSLPQNTPVLTLDALDGWEAWAMDFDKAGRRLLATNSVGTTVIWDLRHFNRHIGGNMLTQLRAHRASLGEQLDEPAAMEQRSLLLSRGKRPPPTPSN